MIELINDPSAKCKKCNKENKFLIDDFSEPEKSVVDKSMGEEVEYRWEHESKCEKCGNKIEFTIIGFEYPKGVLNFVTSECIGAKIHIEPKLKISDEE